MARASATPCPELHLECENIIVGLVVSIDSNWVDTTSLLQIKQRRKRLLPPEPYLVTVKPCTNLKAHPSLDFVLPDEARPMDLSPASDGRRDASPFPGGILTTEGSAGENSSSQDQGGQRPVTVHEFLQDVTRSKPGRKYGRRNRLATVKLDDGYHDHDQDRGPGGPIVTTLAPTPPSCDLETRNGQRISAYSSSSPTRIQSKRPGPPSRPVLHFRRKERFAKSLAQRLFEADVFSSGTSSRPTTLTDQNPAHTPSRRPLQFITSLNLTPSLENRIYGEKQPPYGKATSKAASSASVDSEIQAVSQADDSVPDTLSDGCPAVATSSGKPSSRNWNGATTQTRTRKKIRTGASAAAAAAAASTSGKRAFRTRGGKQSSARVPHNPLEYVPLPLVRVETASRIRRTRRPAVRKPQALHPLHPVQTGHARTHAYAGVSNQFQLMSADNLAFGPRQLKDLSDNATDMPPPE